jgi:catechol 2,3-dioxygenase-like lactoylglutathione lyase family enzyme
VIAGFARIDIAARDAARAGEAYGAFFGREPAEAADGFRLSNLAIRITPAGQDGPEGLARIVFAVRDVAATRRMLERRGVPTLDDGPEAVVETAASHGVGISIAPAERGAEAPPTMGDGIAGLDHVVIRTPDPERAIAFYGAKVGLDFRLDRSNPAWGSRLLFFRCGDAVVEIAADPRKPRSDGPDVLSGLAFRAADPDAARARLAAAGFDVSEARSGRKPGTRVFTLRSGVVGAPALVIGGQGPDG